MKVLVVEDDDALRDVLTRGLTEDGFVVDQTGDGQEALWMTKAAPYSVIVLDVMYAASRHPDSGDRRW